MDNENEEAVASTETEAAEIVEEVITDDKAVESEDSETQEEAAPSEDSTEPPKKSGVQKRISSLTHRAKQAEQDAAYWRGKAEATPTPEPVKEQGEPQEASYESYGDYIRDLSLYQVKQANVANEADTERQLDELRDQQARVSYEQKAATVRESYEDFDEVAYGNFPVTEVMKDALLTSEVGPEILYHLGTNPAESARIAQLPEIVQAREIGRLEAKLIKAPVTTKPSGAAQPITPLNTGKSTGDKTPSDEEDIGTWMKKRRAQVRG